MSKGLFPGAAELEQWKETHRASEGVFRLLDMEVREGSIVDQGANDRNFLLIKQGGQNMAAALNLNPDGTFSTPEEIAKQDLSLFKDLKEPLAKAFDQVREKLSGVIDMIKAVKPSDSTKDEGVMPSLFGQGINSVLKALLDLATEHKSETTKEGPGFELIEKLEPAEISALADEVKKQTDIVLSGPMQTTVVKALTQSMEQLVSMVKAIKDAKEVEKSEHPLPNDVSKWVGEIVTNLKATVAKYPDAETKAAVEKAGKKISDARAQDLKGAITTLTNLAEGLGLTKPEEKKETEKSLPGGVFDTLRGLDPNHPNGGSGVQPDPNALMTAAQAFKDVPGAANLFKFFEKGGQLEKLSEQVTTLKTTVDSQEKTIEKQATALKAVLPGSADTETPAGESVAVAKSKRPKFDGWPSDMNRPLDRETMAKRGVSFYDEDME